MPPYWSRSPKAKGINLKFASSADGFQNRQQRKAGQFRFVSRICFVLAAVGFVLSRACSTIVVRIDTLHQLSSHGSTSTCGRKSSV